MKTIITLLTITCIAFSLTSCTKSTWLYRVNVQQGNVVTSEMLKEIHVGMSKEAVCDVLGLPVLLNTFNEDRWTYVYTLKPSRGKFVQNTLVLYFRNDRVLRMTTRISH